MSIDEFVQWMCFYSIEPFGDKRGDIQAGIISQTLANIHRASNAKPYTVQDFIPQFTERQPMARQSLEEQRTRWRAIVTAQNALVQSRIPGAGQDDSDGRHDD